MTAQAMRRTWANGSGASPYVRMTIVFSLLSSQVEASVSTCRDPK
jgi:hypothetical protein